MPVDGPIARRAQATVSSSWELLLRAPGGGEASLQRIIDDAKEDVLGDVITVIAEDVVPRKVQRYIARIAAVDIITNAIDAWMDKPISTQITGTDEMESWEARIKNMQDHKSRLMAEIAKLYPEVIDLIPAVTLNSPTAPAVSSAEDPFLTPSHQSFPILNNPDTTQGL